MLRQSAALPVTVLLSEKELLKPHYLGHRKRLRQRFQKHGLENFRDDEVLELLLTYVLGRKDTKPLAKELIRSFKALSGVLHASACELGSIPGLGEGASVFFALVRSVIQRTLQQELLEDKDILHSPEAVTRFCRAALEGQHNEVFLVLYLNTKNRVIATERLAEGTIDRAVVFPRRVIEGALKAHATTMIFVHNHPSGDPTPSSEDKLLTMDLIKAARTVDVAVHDHIVIGRDRHFSFRSAGLL